MTGDTSTVAGLALCSSRGDRRPRSRSPRLRRRRCWVTPSRRPTSSTPTTWPSPGSSSTDESPVATRIVDGADRSRLQGRGPPSGWTSSEARSGTRVTSRRQLDDRLDHVFGSLGRRGGDRRPVRPPSRLPSAAAYRRGPGPLGRGGARRIPDGYHAYAESRTLGLTPRPVRRRPGPMLGVLGLAFMGYFAFRAWRARRRTT